MTADWKSTAVRKTLNPNTSTGGRDVEETKLDWDAGHVRKHEGGIAIDVYGETRFVLSGELVDYRIENGRAFVTVPRRVAARLMARPK